MIDFILASVYSIVSPKAIFGRRYVASTITSVYISFVCLSLFIWIVQLMTIRIDNFGILILTIIIFMFNFAWVWTYTSKPIHQAKIDSLLNKHPKITVKIIGILFLIICFIIFIGTSVIVTILKHS
jgi:hypothetical protein